MIRTDLGPGTTANSANPNTHSGPPPICAGCCLPIHDRQMLTALEKTWHTNCIICQDCRVPLIDKCYFKNGFMYCKEDYFARYGTKCGGCGKIVRKEEIIRRARDKVFHLPCFCCSICSKMLDTGEELYILDGAKFICKEDYHCMRPSGMPVGLSDDEEYDGFDDDLDDKESDDFREVNTPTPTKSDFTDSKSCNGGSPNKSQNGDDTLGAGGQKRRGPRTTIKAKQLETLKQAFAATPKPTRHIREQLASETGLNMRVIQVWFQNRRSKERRMKQLRYGPFRQGRRSRGNRDDGLVPAHLFTDGLGRGGDGYAYHPHGGMLGGHVGGGGPFPASSMMADGYPLMMINELPPVPPTTVHHPMDGSNRGQTPPAGTASSNNTNSSFPSISTLDHHQLPAHPPPNSSSENPLTTLQPHPSESHYLLGSVDGGGGGSLGTSGGGEDHVNPFHPHPLNPSGNSPSVVDPSDSILFSPSSSNNKIPLAANNW